jgi:hypothetical protein
MDPDYRRREQRRRQPQWSAAPTQGRRRAAPPPQPGIGRAGLTSALVAVLAAAALSGWVFRADLVRAADRLTGPAAADTPGAEASDTGAAGGGTRSGRSGRPGMGVAAQPAAPLPAPASVTVSVDGFMSWALLDRATGAVVGSPNMTGETNSTESMIKVWIAADYLRRQGATAPTSTRLSELSTMIRDSDDDAAEEIYQLDGADAVVQRMIKTCGLTDTDIFEGWWSRTQISARDAVRMGLCIADGRAAGSRWTGWLLNEMRQVRGEGRFGIIDALPADVAAKTAIKNGWTEIGEDDSWHVNCLAIMGRYVVAVLMRYPTRLGLDYGAGVCSDVARQLKLA